MATQQNTCARIILLIFVKIIKRGCEYKVELKNYNVQKRVNAKTIRNNLQIVGRNRGRNDQIIMK